MAEINGRSCTWRTKPFIISSLAPVFVHNSISLSLFSSAPHVSSQFGSVQKVFISVTNPVAKRQLTERERYDGTSTNHRNLSTATHQVKNNRHRDEKIHVGAYACVCVCGSVVRDVRTCSCFVCYNPGLSIFSKLNDSIKHTEQVNVRRLSPTHV